MLSLPAQRAENPGRSPVTVQLESEAILMARKELILPTTSFVWNQILP